MAVHAWAPDADPDRLAALEADTRALVREVAVARRALADREEEHTAGTRRMLLATIDAVDAFERVFANIEARRNEVTKPMKGWINNFRTVYRLLNQILADRAVTPVERTGDEFDPDWQEVRESPASDPPPIQPLRTPRTRLLSVPRRGHRGRWDGRR